MALFDYELTLIRVDRLSLLFGYLFRASQLYSDMLLQWVFYAPLQVFGYFLWKYGSKTSSMA